MTDVDIGNITEVEPTYFGARDDCELRRRYRSAGAIDLVLGLGEPQRVGRFKFFLDGERWEWSDAVARMHGYEPRTVEPTTELLLQHKHPDDREGVATVLDRVVSGEPFSSRHRLVDKAGHTRCVIVAGEEMLDDTGALIGTSGFTLTSPIRCTPTSPRSSRRWPTPARPSSRLRAC